MDIAEQVEMFSGKIETNVRQFVMPFNHQPFRCHCFLRPWLIRLASLHQATCRVQSKSDIIMLSWLAGSLTAYEKTKRVLAHLPAATLRFWRGTLAHCHLRLRFDMDQARQDGVDTL